MTNDTVEQKKQKAAYQRGWRAKNLERVQREARERYATNPDIVRSSQLRIKFGITLTQYNDLLEKQHGVCASCGQAETAKGPRGVRNLAVDHDHSCCPGQKSCGQCIRALLCARCNSILGLADDDADLLEMLIAYLDRFGRTRRSPIAAVARGGEMRLTQCTVGCSYDFPHHHFGARGDRIGFCYALTAGDHRPCGELITT